jgi:hypothetical protein
MLLDFVLCLFNNRPLNSTNAPYFRFTKPPQPLHLLITPIAITYLDKIWMYFEGTIFIRIYNTYTGYNIKPLWYQHEVTRSTGKNVKTKQIKCWILSGKWGKYLPTDVTSANAQQLFFQFVVSQMSYICISIWKKQ